MHAPEASELTPPRIAAPTETEVVAWLKQVHTRKWGALLAKRSRRKFPQLVEAFAARWRLPIEWMSGAPRHLTIDASVDPVTLARFFESDEALGLAQLTINAPIEVYEAVLDHPRMAQVLSLVVGTVSGPDLARILPKFRALQWLDVEVATSIGPIVHKHVEVLTLRVHTAVSIPDEVRLPNLDWLLALADGPPRSAGAAVELARQQQHLKALLLRSYDVRGLLPQLDVPCLVLDQCQFEFDEVEAWYGSGHYGAFSRHPYVPSLPSPEPSRDNTPGTGPARFDRPAIPWVPRPHPKPVDADALARWEDKYGVRLPTLLRHHLTLDEGSYLWGDAIPHEDRVLTVFFGHGPSRPYDAVWGSLDAFLDGKDEGRAEWVAQGFKPERMFFLAMATQISAVLLDYSHSATDPAVVVLEASDDAPAGIVAARFDSYAEFFAVIIERPTHDYLFMVALEGIDATAAHDWLDARRQRSRFTFGFEAFDGFALACTNTRSDGLVWLEGVPPDATLATLLLDRTEEWEADDLLEVPTPDDLFDAMVAEFGGRWEKLYQST
jgi:hypothetical protein